MLLTKKSILTGKESTMDLDITQEKLDMYQKSQLLIQNVFPHLNADEREFIMTGITPEEWNSLEMNED